MARRLQKQLNERRGLFQRHDSFSAKHEASLAQQQLFTTKERKAFQFSSSFLLIFFFLLPLSSPTYSPSNLDFIYIIVCGRNFFIK
jgi:hypothetical protein